MPWEPLRDLRHWQDRLGHLSGAHAEAWTPPIDVYETEDRFVVSAELPGLAREDVELALEASRLVIRGRRPERPAEEGEVRHFHRMERAHGPFVRTLEFASPIDAAGVSADLSNGVLTVTLPKIALPPARTIEVL